MNIYRNRHFEIEIEFPENWRSFSWHNRKSSTSGSVNSQMSDDDIPESPDEYKILFSAMNTTKNKPRLMGSTLSIEVHYRPDGFDLDSVKKKNIDETSREYTEFLFMGKRGKSLFVILEHSGESHKSYQKSVIWEVRPSIWLSGCMVGDTRSNFEDSVNIFKGLRHLS